MIIIIRKFQLNPTTNEARQWGGVGKNNTHTHSKPIFQNSSVSTLRKYYFNKITLVFLKYSIIFI